MLETSQIANFFDPFLSEPKQYIDLHIHTKASDGLIDLNFLRKFLKNTSHLISITDHNEIKSNLELYNNSKINIVPGIEVGCKDGFELLIYFKTDTELIDFYNKNVKPFKNKYKIARTKQTHDYYLKQAEKYNCFISIPHIYGLAQKNYLNNK